MIAQWKLERVWKQEEERKKQAKEKKKQEGERKEPRLREFRFVEISS